MLTTNYYNMKDNNRCYTTYKTGNNRYVELKINALKQFQWANGNFTTGTSYHYGDGDPIFGAMPANVIYLPNSNATYRNLTIGFDGSNTPASIDDYKLIAPINNCSVIAVTYNKLNNTIIREFTIKNNNANEIIINGVGLFGCFSNYEGMEKSLALLYREVFTSPITVPAGSSFIYRLETTEGE